MKSFLLALTILFVAAPAICTAAVFETNNAAEIQAALDAAASNGEDDTIRIVAGIHEVNGSTLSFVSTECYSLLIEGQGRRETVLDGGGQVRVMAIDTIQTSIDVGTTITVSGMTFRNGFTDDGGGGGLSVVVDLADIVVTKCEFLNNVANPSEDSFIDSYRKSGGGGAFLAVGLNQRASGGDIYVERCKFFGNSTSAFGGGAYIHAIGLSFQQARLKNNIFNNNSAALQGGGAWVDAEWLWFLNNTVTENQAWQYGGGVFFQTIDQAQVYNNITWANSADEGGADIYIDDIGGEQFFNLFSNTFSEATFRVGDTKSEGNSSNEDPYLEDDFTLSPGSPCINTGDNDAPELSCGDYNGHERIHDGSVDRGAIEYGSNNPEDPDCNRSDPINPPDSIPSVSVGSGGGGCFIGATALVDPDSDAYKAAKRIAERHKSVDVQGAIAAAKQRLRPKVKQQCRQIVQPAAASGEREFDPERPELLVFISSSMPADITMRFARDAHQIKEESNIRFVLRGFPKGGLNEYLQGVRADSYPLNLLVDPLLFGTYQVERVPAVVVNRDVRVDHPRDLKSALARAQVEMNQDLQPIIRDLSW